MRELRLAGIHDDGENLVLESSDGATYLLPIDQNLRQSIARARRISPLRGGSASGAFGPRDIQTRFRQGATVEEIAAESGWEPERVRRYEWPIVAERANIIQTARTVVISPAPGKGGTAQSLNQHIEAVSERFDFSQAPMEWSTWQQESGQWTVSVDVELSEDAQANLPRGVMFPARWNFNPANQSIYASNEAAYFLMGRDHSHDAPIPGPAKQAAAPQDEAASDVPEQAAPATVGVQVAEPRIARVSIPEQKEQNELLDELTARRGVRSFDPASERKLADLLERARRSSRPAPASEVQAESAPETEEPAAPVAEEAAQQQTAASENTASENTASENTVEQQVPEEATENSAESPAALEEAPLPAETSSAQGAQPDEQVQGTDGSPVAVESKSEDDTQEAEAPLAETAEDAPEAQAEQAEEPKTQQPKSSRAKRTSVPSWDDIIFGNQRR
ncbi:septation protein SepH [Rothia nasimurium]|uniref:septation protein SepH n=1 Tax=Rothia nasimurium TaxID=85336 RepID=UPI001EED94EB|nr:septation protein SepH [Rothia nasimurium]